MAAGRGLHSSTFQLNLSRWRHRIHPVKPLIPPNTCYTAPQQSLNASPTPHKALTLSRNVDECKPLPLVRRERGRTLNMPHPALRRRRRRGHMRSMRHSAPGRQGRKRRKPTNRGLHSSIIQLNVSAFCGIGSAFMGCCIGGIRGYPGCILCQKRLRLS